MARWVVGVRYLLLLASVSLNQNPPQNDPGL
jgi:hypothetical protein